MIRKFIDRLLGKGGAAGPAEPSPAAAPAAIPLGRRVELGPEQHGIDPKLLDANAVRVVRALKDAGHEAYIVGGAVRDLIVGLRPKDFDVATDATPEQVKALFRRAFIIGRRFRLVHVVFGRGREHETIEVSTFRAYLDATAADQVEGNEKTGKAQLADRRHVIDASGRVLRSKPSSRLPSPSSQRSTRSILPSRKAGVPRMRPVTLPWASRSSSVAISVGTPNRSAIGRVTKSLVAVTIATRSPASRCRSTSPRAQSSILGRTVDST